MRQGILLWSTLSGALLGVFLGTFVLGALALVTSVLPLLDRVAERLRYAALLVLLVIVPIVGGVLGYLEGRAKLS
jgi:hypothetical protein